MDVAMTEYFPGVETKTIESVASLLHFTYFGNGELHWIFFEKISSPEQGLPIFTTARKSKFFCKWPGHHRAVQEGHHTHQI